MKIYRLKHLSVPKAGVLVTGLAAAAMVATISPQAAQATPRAASCTGCHAGATTATTTAKPSTATLAPGASYSVAITLSANPTGGNSGYGIVPVTAGTGSTFGGNTSAALSYTATMVAPAAAGTYSYTVWTNQGPTSAGNVGSAVYSITVAAAPTTPPVTTPPVTTPPVTTPPVTTPPVTTPPVTTPPVSTPPVSTPPVSTPPVSTPPVTPPVSTRPVVSPPVAAQITKLSPNHGSAGTTVTIRGTGFGKSGAATFGTATMKVASWTDHAIVVRVPAKSGDKVSSMSATTTPIWYRHGDSFSITVTPAGAVASNAVGFRLDSTNEHRGSQHAHGVHIGHAGNRH